MYKIMIVEDEVISAMALQKEFTNLGYRVLSIASSIQKAWLIFNKDTPDLILCDIRLSSSDDGVSFAKEIRACSNIPIIFMTGYDNSSTRKLAKIVDPVAYLIKPVSAKRIDKEFNDYLLKTNF